MSDHNKPHQHHNNTSNDNLVATEAIRQKNAVTPSGEPSAKDELKLNTPPSAHPSKHQAFLQSLTTSGRSVQAIQQAWHQYYIDLNDAEKLEVWNEFYNAQAQSIAKAETTNKLKSDIVKKAHNNTRHAKRKHAHHLKAALFGLSMGLLAVVLLMAGFFNERIIAPFITPSRSVSTTPIIVDPNKTEASSQEPKIIIPKINVEVPVVYNAPDIEESTIQNALENGVVRYASSSLPGEQGNTVIVGHSSNNILNKGKYKFAFVLLNRLETNDLFILNRDGKQYVYKVFEKKIVKPSEVDVLLTSPKPAMATLITCDPPGTSLNRLVVYGEQISPDPTLNTASTKTSDTPAPAIVPGNAPSLFSRLWNAIF